MAALNLGKCANDVSDLFPAGLGRPYSRSRQREVASAEVSGGCESTRSDNPFVKDNDVLQKERVEDVLGEVGANATYTR